jgi:hypothetical protein
MPTSGSVSNECPNGTTIRNVEGYNYLLDALAAQGYVTVSIDANALNCRNDFVPQRTQLLLEHLRRWKTFVSSGAPAPLGDTLVGAVDMTDVGLMGHSRGGEAVSLVPEEIAQTPIDGVKVKSIMALAPVDFHKSKPSTIAYSVLVPLCDGDVWMNDGINMYDRIRNDPKRVTPVSQILFAGANHNFFNDVWGKDDNAVSGPSRTCVAAKMVAGPTATDSKSAQRGMLSVALVDWFGATLQDKPLPAYFRGEGAAPGAMNAWSGTKLDLRSSYSGPKHQLLEDFATPAGSTTNSLGQPNSNDGYEQAISCGGGECDTSLGVCTPTTCNGYLGRCTSGAEYGSKDTSKPYQLYHRFAVVKTLGLTWKTGGAHTTFDLKDFDASTFKALSFRIGAVDSPLNPPNVDQDATLRVTDTSGGVAELKLSTLQRVPRLYPTRLEGDTTADVRPAKELLQTVRLPKSALLAANGSLDWAHLKSFDIAMDVEGHTQGAVYITDVEASE